MAGEINCVDIVRPFVDALQEANITNVQLFGGIGSVALGDARTEIFPEERLIIAPADLYLPQHRKDGTLRDLDCLVLSPVAERVDAVEALAKKHIGKGVLDPSIFGLRSMSQLEGQRRNPVLAAAKVHVSDRYVVMDGESVAYARKALFPFEVEMPVPTLETWQLQLGEDGQTFPVPHPGASLMNYPARSVSGVRPKDIAKVHEMTARVLEKWPALFDWITEGDGAPQLHLGRLLHTLREPEDAARTIYLGGIIPIEPYSLDELVHDEAFMFSGDSDWHSRLIAAKHLESNTMFQFEKRPRTVTAWQKHVEPRIQGILKNK
jgi:hypothetical protein